MTKHVKWIVFVACVAVAAVCLIAGCGVLAGSRRSGRTETTEEAPAPVEDAAQPARQSFPDAVARTGATIARTGDAIPGPVGDAASTVGGLISLIGTALGGTTIAGVGYGLKKHLDGKGQEKRLAEYRELLATLQKAATVPVAILDVLRQASEETREMVKDLVPQYLSRLELSAHEYRRLVADLKSAAAELKGGVEGLRQAVASPAPQM